ncbi:predicted protein [Nematostella vectensis]|uniref:Uncharacterized protein n=1 Tax=Nematostella vectensis TaxID=45351 RepID=A7RFQ4_NEMVE|nr:predicted protein [Nematostella vectensis]|eukprot:XP_001641825.1 predicted protein [Nematostella vectensis]
MNNPSPSSFDKYGDNTFDITETSGTGRERSLSRWSTLTSETINFADSSDSKSSLDDHSALESICSASGARDTNLSGYSSDGFESLQSSTEHDVTLLTSHTRLESSESSGEETKQEFLQKKIWFLSQPKKIDSSSQRELGRKTQEFSQRKLKVLLGMSKQQPKKGSTHKHTKSLQKPQLVNTRKMEELRVENIMQRLKLESTRKFHQPKHCRNCQRRKEAAAAAHFIREKRTHLEKELVAQKLQEHLYQKNSVTLIAEIINSGPKPKDAPQDVWDRLLRKGKYCSESSYPHDN